MRPKYKKLFSAILPGIIVAGLIFGANLYYDLDLGRVIVNEITRIIGMFETTATTTLATISGYVGIKTATPTEALTVSGNILATGNLTVSGGQITGANAEQLLLGVTNDIVNVVRGGSTYIVCDSSGNCQSSTGGYIGGSGTSGYIPKFTGTYTIGNSIITDNGTLVTISGQLQTTGTTTLATIAGNVGIGTTDVTAKLTVQNLDTNQASLLIKQSGSLFQKTIGGTDYDYGESIQQTSDGGYVITGGTKSFGAGDDDVFVIKLDSSGNLSWAKTIGGTSYDFSYSIQQTSDGGYVITGGTYSFGAGDSDVFVIKLDSSGNLSWAKTIGGTDWDCGNFIQQTSDGGYVITGETESFGAGSWDVFVIKLDSSGNLSWAKTIGGTDWDSGYSIQQTSDGGYVITGETWSFGAGYEDVFVIKLDSSGNLSWAKTIGGTDWDSGYSIQQTSDGGYVITGKTSSFGAGSWDVFVIKLDSSGNLSWAKTIGGTNWDSGYSIQQTSDGGYVITGETRSFGAGYSDVFVIKLDSSGNLSWAKTIGGTSYDYGESIQQTSDGGYVITGETYSFGAGNSDVFVIKLDSSGNISGCSSIGSPSPTVSSPSPTISFQYPTVYSQSLTATSTSPNVSSTTPTIASQCSANFNFTPLVLTPQGNLAIGVTSTQYQLEVAGKIKATQICLGPQCYSSIPEVLWQKSGNNIVYNTGNVGIGTTTPAYKLTVNGDLYVSATSTLGSATSTPVIFNGYVQSNIIPYTDNQYTLGLSNYRWANIYAATGTFGGTITIGTNTIGGSATTTLFTSGNANQLVLGTNGNVGIGTTAPASLLELYETNASPILTITAATSTTYSPQIAFRTGATPTTKFTLGVDISTGKLKIVPSSDITTSTGITIDSSGNVGIGTTNPLEKLDVYGNLILSGSGRYLYFGTSTIGFREDAYGNLQFRHAGSPDWITLGSQADDWSQTGNYLYPNSLSWNLGVGTSTPSSALEVKNPTSTQPILTLRSYTGTSILTVLDDGNVGIGTTTPVSLLELYKTDASPILTITAATSTTYSPQIAFRTGATPTTNFTLGVDISTGKLKIVPSSDITTSTGITIDSSGNVGIGTTGPATRLHVVGQTRIENNGLNIQFVGSNHVYQEFYPQGVSAGRFAWIGFGSVGTEILTIMNQRASRLDLGTNNAVRVSIDSSGNVGIGTTAPNYKLTVNGDLYVSATSTLGSATSTPVIFGGYVQSNIIPYFDNQYTLGLSNYRWANIFAATGTFGGTITIGTNTIQGSATTTLFTTGNANQLVLGANGNVGIGTTAPGANKLYVAASDLQGIRVASAADENLGIGLIKGTGDGASTTTYNGALESWYGIAFRSKLDGGVRYTFDTRTGNTYIAGNVGIGTTTPVSLLELYKTDASPILTITAATSTTYSPQIAFRTGATPTTNFTLGVDISTGKLKIVPSSDITTSTGITIDSSGNVGIGTTGPATRLHVVGQTRIENNGLNIQFVGSNHVYQEFYPQGVSAGRFAWIGFGSVGTEILTIMNQRASRLDLGTNNAVRVSIDSSGNVGIGTTAPNYKLTVNGDLYVSATSTLGSATSTPVIFGGYVQSNIIPYFDNQYTLGLSNYRWANIFAATGTFGGTITIGTNTIQGSATTTLFTTGNANQLVLGANGNVGIGTTAPGANKLYVAASDLQGIRVASAADENLGIGLIKGTGDGASTTTYNGALESWYGIAFRSKLDGGVRYTFDTRTGNTYIAGNVGIGTTTPLEKLDVAGAIKVGNTSSACDANHRGVIKFIPGGSGVADHLAVCEKDAAGNYAWVYIGSSIGGFKYRKPVTINNTQNTNTLTDYQVLVTLDTASLISAGKMRSDCGDIRFTDSDGVTNLNYWLESGCNTASTKIWVKVPSIPASSSKTIYVYYGNPSATSQSNGDAVFLLFDEFNILDTTKWSSYATASVSAGELILGADGYVLSSNSFSGNIMVEDRRMITANYDVDTHFRHVDANNFYESRISTYSTAGIQLDKLVGGTRTYIYGSVAASLNTYYVVQSWIVDSTVGTSNPTLGTITASWTDFTQGYIRLRAQSGGKFDWIRVRKYTSPEPTTSVGTEEAADIAEWFKIDPNCSIQNNCPEAGDLVAVNENGFIEKSSKPYQQTLIGVISSNPKEILGEGDDNDSRPVALIGTVPVKVTTKNGEIKPGDYLTSSDIPGVAMKANGFGRVIGMALESFGLENDQASSTNNQNCSGVENCDLKIGKIKVFLNPHFAMISLFEDGTLETSTSTTSSTSTATSSKISILDSFTLAIKNALKKLGLLIENGIATLKEIFAEKLTANITITNQLCVGKVCVDEAKFRELLEKNGIEPIILEEQTTSNGTTSNETTNNQATSSETMSNEQSGSEQSSANSSSISTATSTEETSQEISTSTNEQLNSEQSGNEQSNNLAGAESVSNNSEASTTISQ